MGTTLRAYPYRTPSALGHTRFVRGAYEEPVEVARLRGPSPMLPTPDPKTSTSVTSS